MKTQIIRRGTVPAVIVVSFCAAAMARPAAADAPLRPPERHTACSSSRSICATSDPELGTWVHPPDAADRSSALWAITGWSRVLWVTDDGRHLVTGYNGLNLVPQDSPDKIVVVAFWEAGKLLESCSLGDLGYSARNLEKTASHYHSGRYLGIGSDGRFRLAMVDGVNLVLDAQTGALVGRERELEQPAH